MLLSKICDILIFYFQKLVIYQFVLMEQKSNV